MAKTPRRLREIKRSTEASDAAVASRPLVRRRDPRQAELFRTEFVPPCKPTLVTDAPTAKGWAFEIKHDGYRMQAHVNAGAVRLFTKSGLDWADRAPKIRSALERLPVEAAVIDAEAVMVGEDGISDFFALHSALAKKRAPQAFLYAFDLLHLDGQDLRELPLDERRLLLEDLLLRAGEPEAIRFSENVEGAPADIVAAACRMGLEGVVAKRQDAPYRSGPSKSWLKVKCTQVGTFGVTAYLPGSRSLDLAELKDGGLVSVGSVGAGLSERAADAIRARIAAEGFALVEVEYRGRTPLGNLRHPALKGVASG
ncbi:ATP-dependent DNA ligase [Chenggangzhangella methanolivorans]|uniref:ATP-dependent DNA ligase n=1 Tax=Chenggangzhangella methanolivorans TaxID=1437009 RepID=UPI00361590F1